ncbi:MAG: hypothetical protein AAF961_01610, partial [Planctomycetota bacterium]
MSQSINRRRFVLQSVAGSIGLPGLTSLSARSVRGASAVLATRGPGIGARRLVAVGNLLGFQRSRFFPETVGTRF